MFGFVCVMVHVCVLGTWVLHCEVVKLQSKDRKLETEEQSDLTAQTSADRQNELQ